MIPLVLRIQNFLSYGSNIQTIDFRPYKLICLSGRNGHGKSALLDAITWALWGAARKTTGTSKADQGVMRLGATEMMVSFDFIVNGTTYRVRRVFSTKYGKPSAHVDFGTYQGEEDTFIPLTEKTIRKTQEVINKTLGIDYETFINSSFIRQGYSNEFSKKSPKDRKDILASILGLNRYEKAKKYAIEEVKKQNMQAEHAQKMIVHLEAICDTLPSYQQKIITLQTLLSECTLQQESLERQSAQHAHNKQQCQIQLHELTIKEQQTSSLLKEKILQAKNELLITQQQEQALIHQLQKKHYEEVQNSEVAYETTKREINLFEELQKKSFKEIKRLEEEFKAQTAAIEAVRTTTPAHLLINDTHELQTKFERYKSFYQKWLDAGNIVNNELKHLYEKKRLLEDLNNPSCPLCEQNVSQARKRFLAGKLSSTDRFLLHRFEKLKRLITWIKKVITEIHATLEASKKIDTLLQEQAKTHTNLITQQEEISSHKNHIAKKTSELKALESSIKSLQQQAEKILHEHEEYKLLQQKKHDTEQVLQQLIKQEVTEIEQHKKKHQLKEQELTKELRLIEQQEKECKQSNLEKGKEYATLLQEKGALEQAIQSIEQHQKNLLAYKEEKQKSTLEAHDYMQIATAYGKDGIQALLIEDALPELEQEANDLLSKLTDNQTHIFIESLRDLKKGGTKETLDINISDSNGIRPYEMFSGGEAFRIDFALRIAISKLLARRAGTALQTLIIDEGFGSQDEEGLSRIMDVIYKIQDDFEKVIIVSHLAVMKDQFPVHFIIEKEHTGSTVHIKELA